MNTLKCYALGFVGLPYRWGGDDPIKGFDCSGMVIELLQSCGVLPRKFDTTAQGLYNKFSTNTFEPDPEFGTLVFYGKSTNSISHIGFCLDSFRIIEAGGGNSRTKNEEIASRQNAYIRIRPLYSRQDLVGFARPLYPELMKPIWE